MHDVTANPSRLSFVSWLVSKVPELPSDWVKRSGDQDEVWGGGTGTEGIGPSKEAEEMGGLVIFSQFRRAFKV